MATVDMPLEELKKYGGTNPKPADFDEFWDKSIAEMKALDPKVEFVRHPLNSSFADCYDMYFTGTFDTRVHAKFIRPKKIDKPCPAVLAFHGYNGQSCVWPDFLYYAAEGMIAVAMDCRGQAGPSDDRCQVTGHTMNGFVTKGLLDEPERMYYRNVYLDAALLANIVMNMPEVDETRVGAFGGSQGGGLTIACAALEPRIKKAAPLYPFLCDFKRVWEMGLDQQAYIGLRTFFRLQDPMHEREQEYFTKLGYIDLQYLAPRVKADVLMFTGLVDNQCPPSTQFSVYNKLNCPKNIRLYHDYGHEGLPDATECVFEHMMTLKD